MPVSASQHRASTGAHQNMLNKNIRNDISTIPNKSLIDSTIRDDIHHFGTRINRVMNFHEELNKSPNINLVSQIGIGAS